MEDKAKWPDHPGYKLARKIFDKTTGPGTLTWNMECVEYAPEIVSFLIRPGSKEAQAFADKFTAALEATDKFKLSWRFWQRGGKDEIELRFKITDKALVPDQLYGERE